MNYGRVLLPLSFVLLAGCQKAAVTESADAVQAAAVECVNGTPSNSDQALKIIGTEAAASGSAVKYSLSDSGTCVNGQKVAWKAIGASKATTTSSGLTSVFKLSGSYVITAQEKSTTSATTQVVSYKTAVVSDQMMISGPQAGFALNDIAFNLIVPSNITPTSIVWNFGDANGNASTNIVNNVQAASHTYYYAGVYNVSVAVTDANGAVTNLSQRLTIITYQDNMNCITDLAISGATEAKVKVDTSMSVYIPDCLTNKIGAVKWDFGDNTSASNQSVTHAYQAVGKFPVTATLYLVGSNDPWITLDHSINVIENLDVPVQPEVPVDPQACSVQGQTRESQGEIYSDTQACGVNGTKTVSYRDRVVEECKLVVESLKWVEVSRTKEITNEGPCEGQSCTLPDGSLLANGASKVLYSSASPAGSCSTVSESRTCNNGVLSGSASSNQMVCHDGCGAFGSHGTVKTGVETGEVQVAKTCAYGETGIFDIYTQISDQVCTDGQVISSNARQGTIKTAGQCPVYSWVGTDTFTACSADCGGKQSRIFVCKDDKGNQADSVRCTGAAPVEERVCDGNPDAVRRQEQSTREEEANSSNTCPKNQIGVIVKTRDVVTTNTYACIDHSVQLESSVETPTAWVEEAYCRDYVAMRCSQDSLSNTEAKGRYDWMVKCQDKLPIIKEFLTNFADVAIRVGGVNVTVGGSSRELYPTFMNYAYKPEKPWIAPKVKTADCVMPATVYVATVCVSSCATPDQQILVEAKAAKSMKYTTFLDALTNNEKKVMTMQNGGSISSTALANTKVDEWVTELIDTEHDILVFTMKSGRQLKVTPNHPILTADGSMKAAEAFKAGEALVELGGKLDPIVSIQNTKYFGKVYNVFVNSNDVYHNIVITNGYLNGTAYFQMDSNAKDLNRALFKDKLTRGVFK